MGTPQAGPTPTIRLARAATKLPLDELLEGAHHVPAATAPRGRPEHQTAGLRACQEVVAVAAPLARRQTVAAV